MVQCHQDTNKSQAEGEAAGETQVHDQEENLTDLRDLATTLATDLSEWTRSAINLLKSSTRMPTTKLNKKESSALGETTTLITLIIISSKEMQEIREIGQVRAMPTLKRNENRPFFILLFEISKVYQKSSYHNLNISIASGKYHQKE